METAARPRGLPLWLGIFSLQDVLLFAYFGVFYALVTLAPPHADQSMAQGRVVVAAATLLVGCAVGRAESRLPEWLRSLGYRFAAVAAVVQSYLMLRWVLPVVRADEVDAALLAWDRALFGETPAVWLEALATRGAVEYFSFFYASYFALCLTYVLAILGRGKSGPETTRFAVGTLLVVCIGQLGYTAVPAFGPITAMESSFRAPLDGGTFWALVNAIVSGGGAQKDVFPSLHTALPTWFSLYAWGEVRRGRSWRLPALVTTIVAAHIVVSTMFLRWHYAVDVVAGLLLAAGAAWAAPRLTVLDARRRIELGVGGVWSFGRPSRTLP